MCTVLVAWDVRSNIWFLVFSDIGQAKKAGKRHNRKRHGRCQKPCQKRGEREGGSLLSNGQINTEKFMVDITRIYELENFDLNVSLDQRKTY